MLVGSVSMQARCYAMLNLGYRSLSEDGLRHRPMRTPVAGAAGPVRLSIVVAACAPGVIDSSGSG
jgi:hypothetical protein